MGTHKHPAIFYIFAVSPNNQSCSSTETDLKSIFATNALDHSPNEMAKQITWNFLRIFVATQH
jgi:hypothetical protein